MPQSTRCLRCRSSATRTGGPTRPTACSKADHRSCFLMRRRRGWITTSRPGYSSRATGGRRGVRRSTTRGCFRESSSSTRRAEWCWPTATTTARTSPTRACSTLRCEKPAVGARRGWRVPGPVMDERPRETSSAAVRTTAIIACGALAREVLLLRERYGWSAEVVGVPVLLHNTPDRIPPAVLRRIRQAKAEFDRVVVVYGDCGTSGGLDAVLAAEGVERIAGPHCYEIYAAESFEPIMTEAPGTFFLTDY